MNSYSEIVKKVKAIIAKKVVIPVEDFGLYHDPDNGVAAWNNAVEERRAEEAEKIRLAKVAAKSRVDRKVYRPTTALVNPISTHNRYTVLEEVTEEEIDYTPVYASTYTRTIKKVRKIVKRIKKTVKESKPKKFVERTTNLVLQYRLRFVINGLRKLRLGYDLTKSQIFSFANAIQDWVKAHKNAKNECDVMKVDECEDVLSEECCLDVLEHEMDVNNVTPVESEVPVVAANTQMLVATGADVDGLNADRFKTDVQSFSVSDYVTKWNHVGSYDWTSNLNFNDKVFSLDILKDLFTAMTDTPFMLPFASAQFFRGDLEFLFTINTNQFMKGQLLVAAVYAHDSMITSYSSASHVYSLSQKPHVILNAGSCQEAILRVPFKYPFDGIIVNVLERFGNMNYVKLIGRVLSTLGSSQGVSVSTNVTVSVRVIDPVFSGMIGPKMKAYRVNELDHEMFKTALNIANRFLSPVNCDFPPSEPIRTHLVPVASSSMSLGTNSVDSSERLRLNGVASVPISNQSSDFSWEHVSRVPGIIDKFSIGLSDKVGDIVYKKEVSPLSYKSNYAVVIDNVKMADSYAIPPVGVLASMKGYFRGGLNYKFSIVSSAFHACKIIIAFVPGPVKKMERISIPLLRSSFHQQYDILTNKEIEFVVPYISNQVFYPRTTIPSAGGFTMEPYGHLYVQIMSTLFSTQAVSDKIDVIVYQSAGPGLEFSIPNYPALMPDYDINDTHVARYKQISALQGYYPYYVGTWRFVTTPNGLHVPILRYGDVTDHIVQFSSAHKYSVYKIKENTYSSKTAVKLQMYVFNKDASGNVRTTTENVVAIVPVFDGTYTYAIPFNSIALAEKFAQFCKMGGSWSKVDKIGTIYETYMKLQGYSSSQENATYSSDVGNILWNFYSGYNSSHVPVEHESDVNPVLETEVRNMSLRHFGENTMNLKDMCRRMQLYAEVRVDKVQKFLTTSVIVPVSPWGLNLESSIDNITPCRSLIGLIASGFLFFKGSLRFKFICDNNNCKIWVQHRFDDFTNKDDIFVINDVNDEYVGFGQGYASTIFDTSVNGIFSVEIPYYSPCNKIYCNPVNEKIIDSYQKQFFGLGSLYIGCDRPCNLSIFYALGDDAEFSDFVGFPPMLFSADVNNALLTVSHGCDTNSETYEVLDHEMFLGSIYSKTSDMVDNVNLTLASGKDVVNKLDNTITTMSADVKTVISAIPVMCDKVSSEVEGVATSFKSCTETIKPLIETASNTCTNIDSGVNKIKDVVDDANKQVLGVLDKLSGLGMLGNLMGGASSFVTFLLSSVTHCIIGGVKNLWKHLVVFIVSLVSILLEIPANVYNALSHVIGKLYRFNEKTQVVERAAEQIASTSKEEVPILLKHEGWEFKETPLKTNGSNTESEIFQEILGLILGVIYMKSDINEKYKNMKKTDKSFMNLSNYFFSSLPKNIKCTETIISFIKSFWNLLQRIFSIVKVKFFPSKTVIEPLLTKYERIQHWVEEVTFLTHPDRWESIVTREAMVKRVDLAYHFGVELQFILINLEKDNALLGLRRVVDVYQSEISKLRNKCHREKQTLGADREPFFLYMWGGPGIGKSTVKDHLLTEMLKIANVSYDGNMIFTVPINSPYWTGALNQPVAYIDDFNLTTDSSSTQMYQDIVALKSTNVFKPNQADLCDKGRPFCPEILYVNSNMEVPKIPDIVEVEAFMRRPDMFVQVRMSEQYKKNGITKISEIPVEHLRDVVSKMEHLEFGVGTYKGKYTSTTVIDYEWYDYKNFFHLVVKNFISFRANQLIMSENRFKMQVKSMNLKPDDEFLVRANRFLYGKTLTPGSDLLDAAINSFSTQPIADKADAKNINNVVEDITNMCLTSVEDTTAVETVTDFVTFDPKYTPKPLTISEGIKKITGNIRATYAKFNPTKPPPLTPYQEMLKLKEEVAVLTGKVGADCRSTAGIVQIDKQIKALEDKMKEKNIYLETPDEIAQIESIFTGDGNFKHEMGLSLPRRFTNYKENRLPIVSDMIVATDITEVALERFNILNFVEFKDHFKNSDVVKVLNSFEEGMFVEFTFAADDDEGECKHVCFVEWKFITDETLDEVIEDLKPTLIPFYIEDKKRVPQRVADYLQRSVSRRLKFKNIFFGCLNKLKEILVAAYDKTKGLFGKAIDFLCSFNWVWPLLAILLGGVIGLMSYNKYKEDPTEYVAQEIFRSKFCAITNKLLSCDKYDGVHESKANDVRSSKKTPNQRRSVRRQEAVSKMYANLPARAYDHELGDSLNEQLLERINRNTFSFVFFNEDEEFCKSRFFVISGRNALFPHHYVEHLAYLYSNYSGVKCKIVKGKLSIPVDVEDMLDNYEIINGSSLCRYSLPVQFPPARDCKNFMDFSNEKLANMESTGVLVSVMDECVNAYHVPLKIGNVLISGNVSMSEVKIGKAYKYPVHGGGMCGSVLVSNNIIIGMHVAGGGGMGAAESFTDEMLNFDDGLVLDSFPIQVERSESLALEGNYEPIGMVMDSFKSYNPLSSAYEPTMFREEIDIDMAPSRLGVYEVNGEKVSPLMEGVKHHLGKPKMFDNDMMQAACTHYADSLLNKCLPVRNEVGVMEMETACDGIPANRHYKAIDRSTSVGWPYIRMGAEWNKKSVLVGTAGNCEIKPEFRAIVNEQIEMRKRKKMLCVVFDDKLKDEILPMSKINKKGGTRIISCCPIDYLIASRMYLQDFVSSISSANFETECAVGMNVLGADWHNLMTSMIGFSEYGFDGDYSKFGPTLSSQIVEECGNIINAWYQIHDKNWKEEDDNVRKCLVSELMFSWHLASNKVYKTVSGAPSGSPITVVLNSMVNCIYMRMAYYSVHRELNSFLKYVKLITYGDDVLVAVRDKRMFNFRMAQNFFLQHDIKFTPANKDGMAYDIVKLTSCSFLKSGITVKFFKNGLKSFVYQLSIDSIKKILCFHKKTMHVSINESILVACDAALCYLFGHGKAKYNEYKNIMRRILPKYYNLSPVLPTYEEVEYKFVNDLLDIDELTVGVVA